MGSGEGLAEKERRGVSWKKQNKFSDMMPEAERLCRRTGSPSSSCRTDEKVFSNAVRSRGHPLLTGKTPGGVAVSQNAIRSGSSGRAYSFINITCDCKQACGSPDNTTRYTWEVSHPNCLWPAAYEAFTVPLITFTLKIHQQILQIRTAKCSIGPHPPEPSVSDRMIILFRK